MGSCSHGYACLPDSSPCCGGFGTVRNRLLVLLIPHCSHMSAICMNPLRMSAPAARPFSPKVHKKRRALTESSQALTHTLARLLLARAAANAAEALTQARAPLLHLLRLLPLESRHAAARPCCPPRCRPGRLRPAWRQGHRQPPQFAAPITPLPQCAVPPSRVNQRLLNAASNTHTRGAHGHTETTIHCRTRKFDALPNTASLMSC